MLSSGCGATVRPALRQALVVSTQFCQGTAASGTTSEVVVPATDIAVTSCATILGSHSRGRPDRDVVATRHAPCVARNGSVPPPPGRGRFASGVVGIGWAAPAEWCCRGDSPGRFLFCAHPGAASRHSPEAPTGTRVVAPNRQRGFGGTPYRRRPNPRTAVNPSRCSPQLHTRHHWPSPRGECQRPE